jgi:hypothetical protein
MDLAITISGIGPDLLAGPDALCIVFAEIRLSQIFNTVSITVHKLVLTYDLDTSL